MDSQNELVVSTSNIEGFTASVVSAYVANNAIRAEEVGKLLVEVAAAFRNISRGPSEVSAESARDPNLPHLPPPGKPAVPIKSSVYPDHIVCLEDGKKLVALRRHLRSAYQMTPEQYRARWGLPENYPMVAPNYAKRRSELARQSGLGRKGVPAPREDADFDNDTHEAAAE